MTRVTVTSSARLATRSDAGQVRWAVIAANGRVLGVSVSSFDTVRDAEEDFRLLCREIPVLQVSFGRQLGSREWTWRLGESGRGHTATSAGSYERHATARSAYARFTVAARTLCGIGEELDTPA